MAMLTKMLLLMICLAFALHIIGVSSPMISFGSIILNGLSDGPTYSFYSQQINILDVIIKALMGMIESAISSWSGALIAGSIAIGVGVLFWAGTSNSELAAMVVKIALMMIIGSFIILPTGAILSNATPILPSPWSLLFVMIINLMWLAAILEFVNGGVA